MSDSDILHALEDTQFPQKLRGYDPAEVDDLIDRASREIADLRAERKAALDKMTAAERKAATKPTLYFLHGRWFHRDQILLVSGTDAETEKQIAARPKKGDN